MVFFAALLSVFLVADTSAQAERQTPNQPARTTAGAEDTVELELFQVVGSRIKRTDFEGPQPVLTFTAADIETRGWENLGEFIQTLSFTSGLQNSVVQTASFTRGAATANPRGLGANRFLTLLNGRRAVTYPLTQFNNTSVVNLNSIPIGAIESIEFLKDGASAIYGSDAVSGVMDIKLKRNFQGVEASYYVGNTTRGHDQLTQRFNLTAGTRSDRTQMLAVVSWQEGNSTFIRDYARSRTTDYSPRDPTGIRAINQNSTLNFPANISNTAALAQVLGVPTGGVIVPRGGTPLANPKISDFERVTTVGNANRYDFAQTFQLFPEFSYLSAMGNLRHEITDTLYVFGQALYANNYTNYAFTPGVINFPSEGLVLPVNNPFNPFGIPITTALYRTSFGPQRIFQIEENTSTFLIGLGGEINPIWSWEIGATFAQSLITDIARNQIRASELQAAFNGTWSRHPGSFLNPFGPTPNQQMVNDLFTISTGSRKATVQMYDGNITGQLFQIEGRPVGVAVGGEVRREFLRSDPDTAAYVGSGGGSPFRGNRRVYSAYVETTVPILKQLEFQLAGRFEDYSDFGNTTKPKIGFKFRPLDYLILRGSFSQSFKAPDLGQLYTNQTVSFTASLISDPKRPTDPPQQLRQIAGGNPGLQPEEADIYYAGLVFEVPRVQGLELTLDYFDYDLTNLINSPTTTFILQNEDRFPGTVVRDNSGGAPGPIQFLRTAPINIASQTYKGVDFGVNYRLRDTRFGNFTFNTAWTRILKTGFDSGLGGGFSNNTGLYFNPKWKGNTAATWSYQNWGASLSNDFVGSLLYDRHFAPPNAWHQPAVYVFNLSVSHRDVYGVRVQVGVNNLLDKDPPFNGREITAFDQGAYGWLAAGRFVYVRLTKEL
jgi:iron complex outermembrane receptor protein